MLYNQTKAYLDARQKEKKETWTVEEQKILADDEELPYTFTKH